MFFHIISLKPRFPGGCHGNRAHVPKQEANQKRDLVNRSVGFGSASWTFYKTWITNNEGPLTGPLYNISTGLFYLFAFNNRMGNVKFEFLNLSCHFVVFKAK